MSSTSTTWTTDTNTKSGVVQVYSSDVSVLRITADEGDSAILDLFADQGDDNADKWRMWVHSADDDLHFSNYTTGTSWTDILTLQDGGNVGIGQASPARTLDVTGTGRFTSNVDFGGSIYVAAGQHVFLDGGSNTYITQAAADEVAIITGSVERIRVDSAGKVGIGTTSPVEPLHVYKAANAFMAVTANAGSTAGLIMGDGGEAISSGNYGTIYWDGNTDTLNISTQTGGVAMYFDEDGQVGIGTAIPGTILSIESALPILAFRDTTNYDSNPLVTFNAILEYTSTPALATVSFLKTGKENTSSGDYDSYLQLLTQKNGNATTQVAIHIDSDQQVGIGTTSPNSVLHVSKEVADNATLVHFEYFTDDDAVDADDTILKLEFSDDPSEAGTPYFIQFQDSDSIQGSVTWANDGAVAFNTTSDYRIKSNIEPIESSLANINKLKPSSFNVKKATKKANGFIAHELQEVYPSMVIGEKDAVDKDGNMIIQQLAESKLIPFLVKAIQELSAKVEALENA